MNGSRLTHLAAVGSTNDWLLARAHELPDGHWVLADRQTAGRGRRGRSWGDGAGNLMASVLVRADGAVQQLSFVAALALHAALAAAVGSVASAGTVHQLAVTPAKAGAHRQTVVTGIDSRAMDPRLRGGDGLEQRIALKWPNDLLLDGVKVSGILLERSGDAIVIGFGVNLASFPEGTERPATSLTAAGVPVPTTTALLDALITAFAEYRRLWSNQGFEPIRTRWLNHASGMGNRIAARLGNETLEGRFEGLEPDGALALRLDDGTLRPVHAGEVFAI